MMSLERLLDGLEVSIEPEAVGQDEADPIGQPIVSPAPRRSLMVELSCGAFLLLSTHSLAVVPPARAYTPPRARSAGQGAPVAAVSTTRRRFTADGNPAGTFGTLRVTYQGSIDLFEQLGEPLVVKLRSNDRLRRGYLDLIEEIAARQPGWRSMAELLLRRCVILILRRSWPPGKSRMSWLTMLEDEGLARAVRAMRQHPEQPFTFDRLAQIAGMSRSVFATRFAATLARTPMEFLKAIRLTRAVHLLRHTQLPLKGVAAHVGYASRSSFIRAFVARYRVGPRTFRSMAEAPAGGPVHGRAERAAAAASVPRSPRPCAGVS